MKENDVTTKIHMKRVACSSWNCFTERHRHHSDRCDSILVYRTDASNRFHSRILQSLGYHQMVLSLCQRSNRAHCVGTSVGNTVSVLCGDHKLWKNIDIGHDYRNDR